MRDQVKARMEILLEQEIQSRQETSASVADRSPKPVSRTGQTSLTASTTSRAGSSTAESTGGTRQSAKADLVFNVDSGTYAHVVHMCIASVIGESGRGRRQRKKGRRECDIMYMQKEAELPKQSLKISR